MTLDQYIEHYTSMPGMAIFAVVSLIIAAAMHLPIVLSARSDKSKLLYRFEMYYEMIYSATAMLFFIGLYFLVSYRYFDVSESFYATWTDYKDLILLAALVLAIMLINLIDSVLVPLKTITGEHKAALRMMGMIYMLIVFAYIKFIYQDDNYDAIISYFIIMVIGRFVYFDASFKEFVQHIKNVITLFPILVITLLTSGALAWYGFGSEYLLKKNGVVLSLGLAHMFVVIIISIAHHVERIVLKTRKKRSRKKK